MSGATTRAPADDVRATRGDGMRLGGRAAVPGRRGGGLWAAPLACLLVAALSLLLPSSPSYDPWAWLVWGREVVGLDLHTRFGPSWKPLPVLFTAPFSLFGEAAPELWLVIARAGALLGLVAAYRLARRLAGAFAGAAAALTLALAGGYLRAAAIGFSEGLLVALGLLAVDRHLEGDRRAALVLGLGAALLRPEAWPFFGLYVVYLLARAPRLRALAVGAALLVPVLWLGPELWGSGDLFRAASRAQEPTLLSPVFAESPALAVLERADEMTPWPAKVGALVAVAAALAALTWRRRDQGPEAPGKQRPYGWHGVVEQRAAGVTLALAVAGAAWLALVAVMTELGYAGNSRYLAMPIGVCCALGGVGLGWAARALAAWIGVATRARADRSRPAPRVATGTAVALTTLVCAPFLVGPLDELAGDAREVASEARLDDALPEAIARAGGRARVLACGKPYATALQVPVVAWHLRVPTGRVAIDPRAPGVLFRGPPAWQPPDAPAPAPTAGGLRPIVRAGGWTVSAAC